MLWSAYGNDWLEGRAGNDTLWAGVGDDTLIGGAGSDYLVGGDGIDTASYESAGGAVDARLFDKGNSGDAAGDTFSSIENLIGSAYGDTLAGDAGNNVIWGGNGNDTINGREGSNTIYGGNGDDLIYATYNANDTIWGGSGNDTVSFGNLSMGSVSIHRNGVGSATISSSIGTRTVYEVERLTFMGGGVYTL